MMNGSNLVETRPNPNPPPLFQFTNIGKYKFKGLEVSLIARISEELKGQLFYTYLDPAEKTMGRPGHKLDVSFRIERKPVFVSLNGQYVADYYAADFFNLSIPSYLVWNSRITMDISAQFEVFLEFNNIFDKKYQIFVELPGIASGEYPMPGRNLNLGLRLKY